jgi:hypothetical protein
MHARPQRESILFSNAAFTKVKHISIALCARASTVPLNMCHSDWELERPGMFEQLTAAERMAKAHEHALICMDLARETACLNAAKFSDLASIEIDFTNAYCILGCCQYLELR